MHLFTGPTRPLRMTRVRLDASFGISATTWAGGGYPRIIPPKSEANRIGVQAFVLLYSRFVGTDGSSGLRICTREPVRLTDVVETSYPGTQGWYGLQRIFPLEFFLGGLTGIADRFGLRRTTDESK